MSNEEENKEISKEQLWPIDDILASLETECMIGVKLEKDGKISSEERRRRVAEAHSIAFNKLAQFIEGLHGWLNIIEAPTKQKKEYPIDPFGGAPFSEGEDLKR